VGPVIGGATFLALLIAGQMAAALVIDHYGVIGFPVRTVDVWRVAGAILVIAGVFLLARR
jgi:transporter family-2 protein